MQVSGVTRDAILSSAGGDVTVSGGGGLANVSTGGGDLTANNLGGIARFSTAGGDVTGNDLTAPSATVDSSGGDVTLTYTKVPDRVNVSSGGGDITVLLPPGSTRYNISDSTDGGELHRLGAGRRVQPHDHGQQRRRRHHHRPGQLARPSQLPHQHRVSLHPVTRDRRAPVRPLMTVHDREDFGSLLGTKAFAIMESGFPGLQR